MNSKNRDTLNLVVSSPSRSQTQRIYERRRQTLLAALDLLKKREEAHHLQATANEDLTVKEPKWSEAANVGQALSFVGCALNALGVSDVEVDAELRKALGLDSRG